MPEWTLIVTGAIDSVGLQISSKVRRKNLVSDEYMRAKDTRESLVGSYKDVNGKSSGTKNNFT